MSKKKFDPTDTKEMTEELDQSAFFRPPPPVPSVAATPAVSTHTDLQKSANAETQRAAMRKTYDKTSYRLCPEAFDAIETAKRLLRRKFGLRASLEDIAEIALMLAHEDLERNGDQSELVKRLSAILQKQK
jgi:hypothetical protein